MLLCTALSVTVSDTLCTSAALACYEEQNPCCMMFPDCKKQLIMFKFNGCHSNESEKSENQLVHPGVRFTSLPIRAGADKYHY